MCLSYHLSSQSDTAEILSSPNLRFAVGFEEEAFKLGEASHLQGGSVRREAKALRAYTVLMMFLLLLPLPAQLYSQQSRPRIAVLPFNYLSASKSDAQAITGLFEIGLVNTGVYTVIEQERIHEILEVQEYSLFGCTDEKCAIQIGRLLSAEQIVLGTLSQVGGRHILFAKIIDVESGVSIRADRVDAASVEEMTEAAELLAFKLAGLTYTKGAEAKIANEFGELFVETDPSGAEVYVNGMKKGISPVLITRVPLAAVQVESRKGNLYGSREVAVEKSITRLSMKLSLLYGNLFIKSKVTQLSVYLDGVLLGSLGSGLFERVPSGPHPIELKGEGWYWKEEVRIGTAESTQIEAYPHAFGSIDYQLQEGAVAEITGKMLREVVKGKGMLTPVWEGNYIIQVSGEIYEPHKTELSIRRGQTVTLKPELQYTQEYMAHLEAQARTVFEQKLKSLQLVFADGYKISQADIKAASELLESMATYPWDFSDLRNEAEMLLQYGRFTVDLEKIQAGLRSDSLAKQEDIEAAENIVESIKSSRWPFPLLVARGELVLQELRHKEKEQEIQQLTSQKKALEDKLRRLQSKRKAKTKWGLISLASAVLTGGLSVLSYHFADVAYENYQSATITGEAARYRNQVMLWDTTMFAAAGVSGGSFLVSGLLFFTGPEAGRTSSEVDRIEGRIQDLRSQR
jgi:TolB-like protein